ncbi:MAG: sigma-70 family RNA polymerase sigma factor [Terriglobus roseus]|nr:sigma-70 family RNA polymerase sigma factor [Terriglobus roseus]
MRREWTSREGFEELVREHQTMVFRTLHRLTGAGPHVEDLAQDVFLRLFRALPEFRGEAMLSTYLYRIVVNVAQNEWKRSKRDRDRFAQAPAGADEEESGDWLENQAPATSGGRHTRSPEEHLNESETNAVVEHALHTLPETERAVLVLYHQEDLSYQAISAALDMPVNTVRTHLHRGRKRMAELVQERLARQARPTEYPLERRVGA